MPEEGVAVLSKGVKHESFVESRSVAQLIASRLDPIDPWRLALVQRHLVWDEVRMSHLLDSLLAGYPIGSLLVCRVRQGAHVLRETGNTRVAEQAGADAWQLLDGQQRVNAVVAIFTDQGKFGRFYLDMTRKRIPEEVVTRRRDTRRALDYIAWRSDDTAGTEPIDGRDRYIDLGRLGEWASAKAPGEIGALITRLQAEPGSTTGVLNAIDPVFKDELLASETPIATDRVIRLLRAWSEPSIPVQHFTVDTPLDVLQVFTRINLAGVRLDGEDVFFAAVKTEWPDAEENLDRVAAASPLLNRITALRILARLASRARSKEDLLPLRVDRLNGPKGRVLVDTMRRLAADDSPVMARLGVLGRLLTTESALGYGLRLIDDKLLDHVFAWAAVNERADDETYVRAQLPEIETYLIGAQAFRYPTIFLDGFLRLAFAEAIAAGAGKQQFPIQRIVACARRRWDGLKRGQQWVAPILSDDERRHVVDMNTALFLSVLQRLPYEMPFRDAANPRAGRREVEWDHIYPQALANKMRVKAESGYLVHHPDRRLVWNCGNLWALDRPINNHASAGLPSAKFALLDDLPSPNLRLPSRWPSREDAALTDVEREDLLAAELLLEAGRVVDAMPRFRAYVVARGIRIYREIVYKYPGLELFAPSAEIDSDAYEDAPIADLRSDLGLDDLDEVEPETEAVSLSGADPALEDRFAGVMAVAEGAGLADEMRAVIRTVFELGLAVRANRSSVMVSPPTNRTRMLFTVWPQASGAGGRLSIYRWAPAIAEFFPSIDEATARDSLGPDGFGVLERGEVAPFLVRLRTLIGPLTAASGGRPALSGDDIRRIAIDWLRATDPDRRGAHYEEIARAVERQGDVGGSDAGKTVLSAISRRGDLFEGLGAGTYTWQPVGGSPSGVRPTRYWAMRTDPNKRGALWIEIGEGRLRQGWGWDPEMDLDLVDQLVAEGKTLTDWQQQAWANRRMLTSRPDGIHVGDIVLVAHMPEHRRFSLVQVTGPYEYDGGRAFGDYGHILPVRLLTSARGISYVDPVVPIKLQTSLGNRVRLWNLDGFGEELEPLVGIERD